MRVRLRVRLRVRVRVRIRVRVRVRVKLRVSAPARSAAPPPTGLVRVRVRVRVRVNPTPTPTSNLLPLAWLEAWQQVAHHRRARLQHGPILESPPGVDELAQLRPLNVLLQVQPGQGQN